MRRLGWQVLQKSLKERIWICQGQLHGLLLLWTGGAHVSSMQYALIFYDLQLILARMGRGGPPARGPSGAWPAAPASPAGAVARRGGCRMPSAPMTAQVQRTTPF